jgi:predicted benzoate:H+ symporter BenE
MSPRRAKLARAVLAGVVLLLELPLLLPLLVGWLLTGVILRLYRLARRTSRRPDDGDR